MTSLTNPCKEFKEVIENKKNVAQKKLVLFGIFITDTRIGVHYELTCNVNQVIKFLLGASIAS